MTKWKILVRKARWRRKHAVRGEEYDGSKWELHKSYTTKEDAEKALAHLQKKDPVSLAGLRTFQYKLVEGRSPDSERSER